MEFNLFTHTPENAETACILLGVGQGGHLCSLGKTLDAQSGGQISQILQRGDFQAKLAQTYLLPWVQGIQAQRILLVGCGELDKLDEGKFRRLAKAGFDALAAFNLSDALVALTQIELGQRPLAWKIRTLAETALTSLYRFQQCKSEPKDTPSLHEVSFYTGPVHDETCQGALRIGQAVGEGINLARTLGNLPGNLCTPSYLAEQAVQLAQECEPMRVTVLDEAQMDELGMHSLLAVGKGSAQAPRMAIVEYYGAAETDAAPHVLVGKGITFDSGGISLKPGEAMDEMKFDMCGAASVLGTLHVIKRLRPKINLVGVIACAENMPSGCANKPGDIVTTLAGKTVEVLNTDAEGRLVLCDALTYVERYQPASVVDIATLTGACVIALGHHATGLFANNDALAQALLDAGTYTHDRAWRLPLWEDYQEQLDSNFADMQNIGGRPAGSITAACFLARFAENYPWAHLDIAGTAWMSGKQKGATGRPVALLTQYLLGCEANAATSGAQL
ncbi:leucyl aminopeptidase [Allopseudospirillum japonicum]|uniref:Probable cytosol aminopeptidase n=1 Tax=Allopseudospirillum japonicum TaxID=64971 RepID=A0A1H6UVW2_9GAMM|nr:leucyl aminopeptidase [Allopseudospirillum japonicum]SEI92480.1 leucyl aminopeptidase [Allopseudospirillum japonicum]